MPVLSPRRHSALSGSSYLPPSIGGTTSTATSSIIGERKSSIPSSITSSYGSSYRSTSLSNKPTTSSLTGGYSTSGYSSGSASSSSSSSASSSSYLRSPASYRNSLYNSSSSLTGGASYRYSTYGNYDTTSTTGITSGTSSRFGNKTQQQQQQQKQQADISRHNNSNNELSNNSNGEFNDVIGSLTLHDSKPITSIINGKRFTTTTTTINNSNSNSNPSSTSSSPLNKQQQLQLKLNNSKNLTSIHKTQFSTYRDTNFLKTECELAKSQLVKSTIAKFQKQQQQQNLEKHSSSDDNSNNNSNNCIGIINGINNGSTANNNHSVNHQTKNNHFCDNNNVNTILIADNIKKQQQPHKTITLTPSSSSSSSTTTNQTRLYAGDYAGVNKNGSSSGTSTNKPIAVHHNSRTTKLSPLVHRTGERIANTTKQLLQQKPKIILKNQSQQDVLQQQQKSHQKQQQLLNNNMNCFQNSPDLLDDIKYIDSDDSERHPSQYSGGSVSQQTQQKPNLQSSIGVGILAKQIALKDNLVSSTTKTSTAGETVLNHHNLRYINGGLSPTTVQLKSSTLPITNSAKYRSQNLLGSNNLFLKNQQSSTNSDTTTTTTQGTTRNIKYNTLNDFKRMSSNNTTNTSLLNSGNNTIPLTNSNGKSSTSTSIGNSGGNVRNTLNSINNSINKPILTSLKNSTVIVSSDLNNENSLISSKKIFNATSSNSSSSSLNCSSPVPQQQQLQLQSGKYNLQQYQQQQQYPSSSSGSYSNLSNFKSKLNSVTSISTTSNISPLTASAATTNLLRNNSCSRESTPSSSPQLLKRNFNNSILHQQQQQQQQNNGSNSSLNSIGSNSNLLLLNNVSSTTILSNNNQKHNQKYTNHLHNQNQNQHQPQQTPKEIFFNGGKNTPPLSSSLTTTTTTANFLNSNAELLGTTCCVVAVGAAPLPTTTTDTSNNTTSLNNSKYVIGRNSPNTVCNINININKENDDNNIKDIITSITTTSTTTTTTSITEQKTQSNRNKCDNDESVRTTSLRSALPSSPTPSRYWDRETATGGRSSSRHLSTSNNDNDDYLSSSKNDSSSDSYEKGGTDGLCGLRNIGNTCFMNSVIQCLSHTKELTKFLKTQTNYKSSSKDGQILYEFAKLIRDMWTPNISSVTPLELKSAFSSKHRMYSGYNQQDAQEFLRFFLDSLHSALNNANAVKGEQLKIDDHLSDNKKADLTWEWYSKFENSMIKDLFVGQLKSTLRCTTCGNTSVTFDPFWDLSVPLPSSSRCKLESCLDLFIKEEVLDGDEMPTCSKCKTRRKCTKSFTIQRFPKYLVIHLKRFSETRWSKLSNIVEFPTSERELNMAPYAANSNTNVYYSLYGISNHMGSTAGGHYVALCKHAISKKWHEFNDNIVSDELSESHLVSSSAYLLFYERAN